MFNRNKKWFAYTHWRTFAIYEGLVRIVNLSVLRAIAEYLIAPIAGFAVVGFIGVIRCLGGLLLTLRSGFALFPNARAVLGSMLTGLLVAYTTLVPLYVFIVADVSLLTFAILLIIGFVPGMLMSTWLARGTLPFVQLLGLLLSVGLGYWWIRDTVTDGVFFPVAVLLLSLPFAAFAKDVVVTTMGTARTISAWVHNVWVGLAMMIFSTVALFMFNNTVLTQGSWITHLPIVLWLSVLSGFLYLLTVLLRQKAFQDMGGVFAKKKVVIAIAACGAALVADLLWFKGVSLSVLGALVVALLSLMFVAKR